MKIVETSGVELIENLQGHPRWTAEMLAMPYAFDMVWCSTEQCKEVCHWCRRTFGKARRWKYAGRAFFFEVDAQAVMFKLRWM